MNPTQLNEPGAPSGLNPLIQNALNRHKLHNKHHHHHRKQKLKEMKEGKLEKRGRKMKMKIDSKMKCGSCGNVRILIFFEKKVKVNTSGFF